MSLIEFALGSHLAPRVFPQPGFSEIHARSLANFYCLYAGGQTHEFEIHATRQRARTGDSTICYRKKQIGLSL